MASLKLLFGFLFALWSGFWFMLVVTLFTILYAILFFFTGNRFVKECIWINCRYLCNFLLIVSLIRKRVHGRHNLAANKPYIFVCNHLTQFDTIVAASCLPQPASFIAKSELRKIPFFGKMVMMLAIPVDRTDRQSREDSYKRMALEVAKGNSLFLFPEGTRNRTSEVLLPFKNGAFKTAILAQSQIAVITLVGMNKINKAEGIQLFPGVVDVYFSKPISTAGMTLNDLDALKSRVAEEMTTHLSSTLT